MTVNRRTLLGAAATAPVWGALPYRSARAQAANTIRIGVLNDQSGLYRDISGPGSTQRHSRRSRTVRPKGPWAPRSTGTCSRAPRAGR